MASHAIFSFPRFLRSTTGFRNIFTSIESFCIDSNTKEIPPFLTILPKVSFFDDFINLFIFKNAVIAFFFFSNYPYPFSLIKNISIFHIQWDIKLKFCDKYHKIK